MTKVNHPMPVAPLLERVHKPSMLKRYCFQTNGGTIGGSLGIGRTRTAIVPSGAFGDCARASAARRATAGGRRITSFLATTDLVVDQKVRWKGRGFVDTLLDVVSEDVRLHRWRLRFGQYGSHPIRRVLHCHALNAFAAPRAVG